MRAGIALVLLAACGAPGSPAADLEGACASCHSEHVREHAAARHGQADRSPVFRAMRAEAERAWAAGAFCDGCHRPMGGFTCLTCHAAVGNLGFGDGALVWDLERPVGGAQDRSAPHAVEARPFLSSADLCGTCHEVEGPGPFTERPFTHWRGSPAGRRNQTCQDCHMPKAGRTRHRPVGLTGGSPDEVQALLRSALSLRIRSVRGEEVEVEVASRLDGHLAPDGASFVRALWLEVRAPALGWASAHAPDGAPVFGDPRWLSARLFAGDEEVAHPTRADRAEARGLAPGEGRVERFSIPGLAGPVEACLRFRRYRVDVLDALGIPSEEAGPTLDVVCARAPGG